MILTTIIASKLYVRLFGEFHLIPLSDIEGIKEYFMSGAFVLAAGLFLLVYKVFFGMIDYFLFERFAKASNKIYESLRSIQIEASKEDVEEAMADKDMPRFVKFLLRKLKEAGVMEVDGKKITPGLNFKKLLKYFKDLHKEKDVIDSDLAYMPFAITLMFWCLFDSVVVDHFVIPYSLSVVVNILCAIVAIVQLCRYFINVFVELKYDKIYFFMKRVNSGEILKGKNSLEPAEGEKV
jgi:hypothetical protein